MENSKFVTFICCLTNKINSNYLNLFLEIENEFGEIERTLLNSKWIAPIEYINEMGDNLQSEIWIFNNTFSIEEIIRLKHWLMFFENQSSINGRRSFNLNPGYISQEGMYLLTHKDNPARGREKIDDNIWQEKQYLYKNGKYVTFSNTFSEYLNYERLNYFNKLREWQNIKSNKYLVSNIIHE